MIKVPLLIALVGVLGSVSMHAQAAPSAPSQLHIRGVIQNVSGQVLTVKTSTGVETIQLAPKVGVADIVPTDRARIKPGSFVGITSVAGPHGSQRAVEVHVFPESMRGAGEGSRPWDYPGAVTHSKMTNGTVGPARSSRMTNGTVSSQTGGTNVTVSYKSASSTGAQSITIPPGIPVITFAPGSRSDLKPGAHVFVMAVRSPDGKLLAGRVMVGKNGLVPPM